MLMMVLSSQELHDPELNQGLAWGKQKPIKYRSIQGTITSLSSFRGFFDSNSKEVFGATLKVFPQYTHKVLLALV